MVGEGTRPAHCYHSFWHVHDVTSMYTSLYILSCHRWRVPCHEHIYVNIISINHSICIFKDIIISGITFTLIQSTSVLTALKLCTTSIHGYVATLVHPCDKGLAWSLIKWLYFMSKYLQFSIIHYIEHLCICHILWSRKQLSKQTCFQHYYALHFSEIYSIMHSGIQLLWLLSIHITSG